MGRPKLLLPSQGTTILGRLMSALDTPRVLCSCVVMRADDRELQREAERHSAWVVQPAVDPPDMRTSVEVALTKIEQRFSPLPHDAWVLVPADHPWLSPELLAELLTAWDQTAADILVPTFDGQRGHPTVFRWSTVAEIRTIPPNEGLNRLVRRQPDRVTEWPCRHPEVLYDLDTPEDYQRLLESGQ